MNEKITINLFYMGLISAVLAIFLTGTGLYHAFQTQVESELQQEATLIAAAYDSLSDPAELARFAVGDLRLTLVEPDGTVCYESSEEPTAMENHSDRPEIQAALATGTGQATRDSDTFGNEEYYFALRLEDGNVLRVSMTVETMYMMLSQAYPKLLVGVLVLIALSIGGAMLLTRRLLKPLIQLPEELDDPDLAEDASRVYPELAPFVREIQRQRTEQGAMRQEFTANVSHELKTPLTTISGYAEMIATGLAKPEDVPRFAEKVQAEADRMLTLVNDIIELSRLDREMEPEQWQPVDLLELAQECADQLSTFAQKKQVTISVSGASAVVEGEGGKLWELVYNLADNAIRYNREGGRVELIVSERMITVKDNGIGIPREHQGRIFERFYRVDKSHSRVAGGTGLGLSIVKHIAEQHHARITLVSDRGVGTEIRVFFPQRD